MTITDEYRSPFLPTFVPRIGLRNVFTSKNYKGFFNSSTMKKCTYKLWSPWWWDDNLQIPESYSSRKLLTNLVSKQYKLRMSLIPVNIFSVCRLLFLWKDKSWSRHFRAAKKVNNINVVVYRGKILNWLI